MRRNHVVLGLLVLVSLVVCAAFIGCPGPEEPEEPAVTSEPIEVRTEEQQEASGEGAETADGAEELGDVLEGFEMPSSFVMTMKEAEAEGPGRKMAMKMDGEKASKVRIEQETASGTEVTIMDLEDEVMYSYDTASNEGMKLPMQAGAAQDAPVEPWEGYEAGYKIVGSETMDGVDCWIVEITEEGKAGTVWIGKQDGLMRRVESPGETMTMTITDVNSVPDSEFEVPEDIEIGEMPDMPGGDMPDMPTGDE